ncbi:ABC transporter ATP-binding protein [Streptomyces sp. Tue6028]|uniref:ABC transporter ATP-binding protein n=1 Tax=Streptomyces sp. Tue6028 TaxID=2036037 RepID=UPI003F8F43B5
MIIRSRPPDPSDPSTPIDQPAVRAQELTVVRGTRTVLRGLEFAVPRGQITGLLGPSGCGKSTLMRSIVGTQAKVTGTLDVLGRPAGDPALRSRIGYVTQAPSVYDDLTVRQNLDYFAAILDPGRAAAERRRADVTQAIADVDLTSHADALAGNLSGGQRSRVSLAVALLGTPELLVLDEPTVGLDPVLRRDLWNLFHTIAAERNATLLVSSHVMDEAERCHRLLLMREGRILADDTPDALRARFDSDTVEAAFLRLVDEATAAGNQPAKDAERAPDTKPAKDAKSAPDDETATGGASAAGDGQGTDPRTGDPTRKETAR